MLDRYMRAYVRIHSVSPQRVKELSADEVAEMFLTLPAPTVTFDAWCQPFLAPVKQAQAEQKAAVDGLTADPVLAGMGIKVEAVK